MNKEVFHKVDIGNFSEIRTQITRVLERIDFLHIQSLNQEMGHLNRAQLMSALDALEREKLVEIRKTGSDLYVSLA